MIVIRGLDALRYPYPGPVATIGNFDGVHRGHQKIFSRVAERAGALRGTPMAVTFEPHPVQVISPEKGIRILTPFHEKIRLMELFGITVAICVDFSPEFARMRPDDFIREVIVDRIRAREVIVGHNYAFGKEKQGTTDLLRRRGKRFGFVLRVVRHVRISGEIVSSSRVRRLLGRGRVCEASWLLGRPYMIEGTVIRGAGRGKDLLNIPTANIAPQSVLLPKEGVYAVKVACRGRLWEGVANLGRNPTFGGSSLSCEIHILDFSDDVVGEDIKVSFIDRLRDERTFPDVSSLKAGIEGDIRRAQGILKSGRYLRVV
jgi:riboflavin kinase/FMN adenylyltransferase